ncbi:MAG: hypothetical protein M3442_21210, partial [Chloroflexota bacterium]|nr:hypothetical protein [Chloroflexota bacterium]
MPTRAALRMMIAPLVLAGTAALASRGRPGWFSSAGVAPPAAADLGTPAGADPPADPSGPPGEPAADKPFTTHPYPSPAELGGREWVYFRETGHYVSGPFKAYFEANRGLAALGYPITEELTEDGWRVQYFQRARLERQPPQPAGDQPRDAAPGLGTTVQRALLGDLLLALRPEQLAGAAAQPLEGAPAGARIFPETGHAVSGPTLEFFTANGGPASFGYPVSRAERGVQWFQRARLEWTSGTVQAALIGDEYVVAAGLGAARARATPPSTARGDRGASADRIAVHVTPGGTQLVTRLPQDAQVRVAGEQRGADGEVWYAVRLWNAIDGFVSRDALAFTPAPLKSAGAGAAPWKPAQPPPQGPFPLHSRGQMRVAGELAAAPNGSATGSLAAGTPVRLVAWATDAQGRP